MSFRRVLVTKPHNKTPYELLTGKIPIISYIRPFGCHVTILNTIDHLGKFVGKSDEGFLVGYSLQSKAFRVYNLETKRVEENLHITFLENKPNVAGKGPTWLFDLDYLTDFMNYHPASSENQANLHAEDDSNQDCFVLPIWPSYSSTNTPAVTTDDKRTCPREEEQVFMDNLERLKKQEKEAYEEAEALRKKFETLVIKEGVAKPSSTNIFSTVSTPAKASSTNLLNTASIPVSTTSPHEGLSLADPTLSEEDDSEIPPLEDIYQNSTNGIFTTSSFDDEGRDPNSAIQTRSKVNTSSGAYAFVSYVQKQKRTNHKDFHHCLFAVFLSHITQEDFRSSYKMKAGLMYARRNCMQFEIQQVWVLVDFAGPYVKKAMVQSGFIKNMKGRKKVVGLEIKQGLDAQGHRQEEGIDYDEDVKSAFLYGKIDEEVTPKTSHLSAVKRIFKETHSLAIARSRPCGYFNYRSKIGCAASCCAPSIIGFRINVRTIGLKEFREVLSKVTNGTDALLLPTLFFLWLGKVSTASAKLVLLGKVCTALEMLKKNTDEALIFIFTTISIPSKMAVLDSCPKHNMVAYLEKSEGNAEFHEIRFEQFWTSAKSKTINNVRHITAKVAGKSVSISEASIRSDLLFDDADGIDSLPNQAIFDAIQLMGYEGDLTVLTFNKALFSPQWRFLFHTINHCLSSKSTSWDQIPTNIATAVICLTSNQKYNFSKLIFDGMLRHLDAKKKFVMYPRFISIFLGKQLDNVSVPLDHFPVNTLTSKVFSFMVKKGKHFSGKVTPLFATMLVQPTQDEGVSSERPSEAQPTPSPVPTSEVPYEPQTDSSPAQTSEVPIEHQSHLSPRPSPTTNIPGSIPESSGENLGGHSSSDKSLSGNEDEMTIQSVYDICLSLCKQVSDQAKEIQALKAQITKLKKQAKPVIKHHRAYLKSVSVKQRFPRKSFSKKHKMHKESVSKQGRKFAKGESSVQRDPLFDVMPEDTIDHMETENAQSEGRTREMVDEDKEIDEVRLSTEDEVSTVKEGVSTDFEKVSTDRPIVSTDAPKVSTDRQVKGAEEQVNEGADELKEGTDEHIESTDGQIEGTEEKVESTDGQFLFGNKGFLKCKLVLRLNTGLAFIPHLIHHP
ncbi:putative ribonuclease H-like domain-containing protein [Tanacetum coccineum]